MLNNELFDDFQSMLIQDLLQAIQKLCNTIGGLGGVGTCITT